MFPACQPAHLLLRNGHTDLGSQKWVHRNGQSDFTWGIKDKFHPQKCSASCIPSERGIWQSCSGLDWQEEKILWISPYNTFGPRTPMWNTSCGHQEEPTPNPCLPFTGPCALESHHHLMATLTRPGAAAYILTWPFLHRWTKCRNMVLYCQEAHTSATPDHLSTLIFGRVPGSTLLIWPISSFWSFPKAAPHLRSSPHCWPSSTPISPFSHS